MFKDHRILRCNMAETNHVIHWNIPFVNYFSFCAFSFDHYVVCPSSIYGFWFPLWYFQVLFSNNINGMNETTHLISKRSITSHLICILCMCTKTTVILLNRNLSKSKMIVKVNYIQLGSRRIIIECASLVSDHHCLWLKQEIAEI